MDKEQEGETRSLISPKIKPLESSLKNAKKKVIEADSELLLRETVQCRENPQT